MQDTPYGYCECGCGQKTAISTKRNRRLGYERGKPRRFRIGHNAAKSLEDRIWDKLAVGQVSTYRRDLGPCLLWIGAKNARGYGIFGGKGCRTGRGLAHRVVYELLVGPIPEGLHLDHLCRVPNCVRPKHLEPVTPDENWRRGKYGVLYTHCVHGHLFSEANTYVAPNGKRRCRTCIRRLNRERDARLRSAQATCGGG